MNTIELKTAHYLLRQSGITLCQAARLALDGIEQLPEELPPRERWQLLRDCLKQGIRLYREEQDSVSFRRAAAHGLQLRQGRSVRTVQDFRQIMNRLMQAQTSLAERKLNTLTAADCRCLLEEAFASPVSRRKARVCLSSLFNEGMRQGWCRSNPVRLVPAPTVRENTISPLSPAEIRRLLRTAATPAHAPCLPPLLLMVYAGVRPQEVTRLNHACIDREGGDIIIPPRHSKTGGGRHIGICPALRCRLRELPPADPADPICPPNWSTRWRQLRRAAGFPCWQQDILRHTFASYFARAYRDLSTLQLYMGHRDVRLLLTRYVNLRGITRAAAASFFGTPAGKAF